MQTAVKTRTSTNVKLGVAVALLLAAGGAAFAAFNINGEDTGRLYASVDCHNGSYWHMTAGGTVATSSFHAPIPAYFLKEPVCRSGAELDAMANEFCSLDVPFVNAYGYQGKMGVNSKSFDGACELPAGYVFYPPSPTATTSPYRTRLSIAFAGDSPQGVTVSGDDAVVAKFILSSGAALSGQQGYDAIIQSLNFVVSQTGIRNTGQRELKVYKDSITPINLVATTNWPALARTSTSTELLTDVFNDASFFDVIMSPGSSKLFIVTMDTQDAGVNDRLSVGMSPYGVTWFDRNTRSTTTVSGLPLVGRFLNY